MVQKDFVLVYGPQGSGKTTQSKYLADHLGYKFLSTGELFRDLRTEQSPLGVRLAEYWVAGELVPDELVEEIIFPILDNDEFKGFVLDGYPRDPVQLKSFKNFLNLKAWSISKVFYLDVGVVECVRRMKSRADLEKRPDETDHAIVKRLDLFYEKTLPLLGEFEDMGVLFKVDGERSIEEIKEDIETLSNAQTPRR